MIHISAFADEISADLEEQIAVLLDEHIHYLELRGVWDTNVLDLTDAQVATIKQGLDANGIGVSAIGSPIGKVPIDSPFGAQIHRFERAITLARAFNAPYIRLFSFYPPSDSEGIVDPVGYRDEVLHRLKELTARAAAANITLLHENEKDIYGDTVERCVDLLRSVDHPRFQALLDPANFLQCAEIPYPDAYDAIKPWLRYVHVKDALADGSVVTAGEGLSRWPELLARLRADGYDGFLSLEPHLAAAGQFKGFSGPELFRRASQAVQWLLRTMEWDYV